MTRGRVHGARARYGSVLGQMAAYVESMISVASRSAQQIDQVDSIMVSVDAGSGHTPCFANAPMDLASQRKIGLPADVQRRVHSFYDYMYVACKAVQRPGVVIWCVVLMHGRYRVHGVSSPAEEVAFLKDLTPNLKLQIMIHKCKAVIGNCPLFTTMPAMFRLELLNGLQHCVFMPGDYVCQIGSVAKVWQLRHAVLWWCPLIASACCHGGCAQDVYFVSEGQVFVR